MSIVFSNSDDIVVPSVAGQTYLGGAGNDTYILSNVIDDGDPIVIQDTEGENIIQLLDGLSIESSIIMQNALQLTLSNGGVVQILGASSFTYDIAGNVLTETTGTETGYNNFSTQVLGGTVPSESGEASLGGSITIDDQITIEDNPVESNTVSADIGSLESPVILDASNESYIFTDDAGVLGCVEITNFTSDDVIQISNAVSGDYSFEHDGEDMRIVYNNNGVVSQVTLVGVVESSDVLSNEADFEAAIGFNAVTYV